MDFDNDTFCKRFTELRENSGKSQEELAHILGVTQQTLSRYEKKQRQPSIEFIVKASKFFKVTTDYLLGLSDILTTDVDIQKACTVTGLSEKAINRLSYSKENVSANDEPNTGNLGLNHFIEDTNFMHFANQLHEIYLIYKEAETNIMENLYCASDKAIPLSEIDKKVDEALNLISLIGYKTINKTQYFDLCIQNAIFHLQNAFKDWLEEIKDNYTECFYE